MRFVFVVVILSLFADFIVALKDVSVMIPQAVKRGSNALFTCNYDMENDTLYSVKWYKGKREFYRYTPKENPAMKVFAMSSGLNVERNLSNQSHVVLQSVPLNISGKFTCEISVEAPTFQTAMVSGEMEVVELPEEHTVVTGIQARYRIGDLVDGNCSIKYSKPAANLTWTINGIVVPPHHIKTYQIEKQENSTLESVTSAIHFMVTTQHFLKGQMRLKCTSTIFDIFKEEIESVIEEDRPRIMASGRSYDINNYPLEEHANGGERNGGYEDHNESYLTYYSADSTSGASTAAHEVFLYTWLTKLTKVLGNRLKGAWQLHDAFASWISVGGGAASVLFCWLLAHQIIDCQYTKARQVERQTAKQQSSLDRTKDIKCFYNCQMATLCHHPGNLAENVDTNPNATANADNDTNMDADADAVADANANADGNIASVVVNAGDDLTAMERHQQLSATLAAVGKDVADSRMAVEGTSRAVGMEVGVKVARLDQRLLMTWRRIAESKCISC
ncbi:uncharacterized protein Dwil_GK24768 [Drosophila willistoni]|uniref:Ig-like domain-containing protein n=1 Tax=Drosophila willistoni TaxID=7260 RepID=B4N044_DROWI|nr:uncharacterized protein LOC6644266 [Drosophila willistoni]EDW77979.2 uncharacterized protein Dwil_GK24768 [Drosophila willistoni]